MPLLTLQELEQMTPLFRGKVGHMLCRGVMRILAIDKVTALYDRHCHWQGADFAHSVLHDLGICYNVYAETPEVMSQLNILSQHAPFITISNHPYGSLDGVILADYFGHLCSNYKLLANKLLQRIEALSSSFIPVVPAGADHTTPTKESILGIRHALTHLQSGGSLGLFPAGAVSDLSLSEHRVRDREWQISIIRFIAKAEVPILPVCFFGGNSLFYYLLGVIDWRIRLLRLPAEVFNKSHHPLHLGIGPLISVEEQQQYLSMHTMEEYGLWLRSRVYGMSKGTNF